ncbi:MAG: serine--tRNA ligase, partial [Altibacter sp.]|nr:serine--tRNA ligase [Altibacter sp.]
MLQVQEIREHKEAYIAALAKRGVAAEDLFEKVMKADEERRNTQLQLDETLAQSNT